MAKAKRKVGKVKKKHWFPIIAPKMFGEKVMGETYVVNSELIKGKHISYNLKNLGGYRVKQNIDLKFVVDEVKEGKAYCKLIGYSLLKSSIKRLMSKNKNQINISLVCKSLDNKNIRIKLVLITRQKVNGAILAAIRHGLVKIVVEKCSKRKFEDIIADSINFRLPKEIKTELSKIYPIGLCTVKNISLEKENKRFSQVDEVKEVKEVDEVKEDKEDKEEEKKEKKVVKKKSVKKDKKEVDEVKEVKEVEEVEEVDEVKEVDEVEEDKKEVKKVSEKKGKK